MIAREPRKRQKEGQEDEQAEVAETGIEPGSCTGLEAQSA